MLVRGKARFGIGTIRHKLHSLPAANLMTAFQILRNPNGKLSATLGCLL